MSKSDANLIRELSVRFELNSRTSAFVVREAEPASWSRRFCIEQSRLRACDRAVRRVIARAWIVAGRRQSALRARRERECITALVSLLKALVDHEIVQSIYTAVTDAWGTSTQVSAPQHAQP